MLVVDVFDDAAAGHPLCALQTRKFLALLVQLKRKHIVRSD